MKIGITTFINKKDNVVALNNKYVEYVINAGYTPVLIPQGSNPEHFVDICDGLLLPGGPDIEPNFYNEDNISSRNVNPTRDNFERHVLFTFIEAKKKVFGICRGFQLIARTFLYTHKKTPMIYVQHISGHSQVYSKEIPRNVTSHRVFANIKELYGKGTTKGNMFVNSIHHQALTGSSDNLQYVINADNSIKTLAATNYNAKVKNNVVVEAIDVMFIGTHLRGVQWHPEELNDTSILKYFFEKEVVDEEENKEMGSKHIFL